MEHSGSNSTNNTWGSTTGLPGDDARYTSSVAFRQLHALLELENEIELRIAQLRLSIEKRGAWPALGYKHVVEFGVVSTHQSASTTRARLRVARAMEISPALKKACESGFTHQRALRLVALIRPDKSNESFVKAWVGHARQITIKRLDDELRAFGKGSGWGFGSDVGWEFSKAFDKLYGGTLSPGAWPAPLSDQA